jgi:hypothetical protein
MNSFFDSTDVSLDFGHKSLLKERFAIELKLKQWAEIEYLLYQEKKQSNEQKGHHLRQDFD